jgi:hypothetical protein
LELFEFAEGFAGRQAGQLVVCGGEHGEERGLGVGLGELGDELALFHDELNRIPKPLLHPLLLPLPLLPLLQLQRLNQVLRHLQAPTNHRHNLLPLPIELAPLHDPLDLHLQIHTGLDLQIPLDLLDLFEAVVSLLFDLFGELMEFAVVFQEQLALVDEGLLD